MENRRGSGIGEKQNVTASSNLYAKCSDMIHFLEKKLLLPENVVERTFKLLDRAIKDGSIRLRIQGRKPAGIAAALVYIAAKLEGEWLTQREILEALNGQIVETTLRKNYHKLMILMGMGEPWLAW